MKIDEWGSHYYLNHFLGARWIKTDIKPLEMHGTKAKPISFEDALDHLGNSVIHV